MEERKEEIKKEGEEMVEEIQHVTYGEHTERGFIAIQRRCQKNAIRIKYESFQLHFRHVCKLQTELTILQKNIKMKAKDMKRKARDHVMHQIAVKFLYASLAHLCFHRFSF